MAGWLFSFSQTNIKQFLTPTLDILKARVVVWTYERFESHFTYAENYSEEYYWECRRLQDIFLFCWRCDGEMSEMLEPPAQCWYVRNAG